MESAGAAARRNDNGSSARIPDAAHLPLPSRSPRAVGDRCSEARFSSVDYSCHCDWLCVCVLCGPGLLKLQGRELDRLPVCVCVCVCVSVSVCVCVCVSVSVCVCACGKCVRGSAVQSGACGVWVSGCVSRASMTARFSALYLWDTRPSCVPNEATKKTLCFVSLLCLIKSIKLRKKQ